MSELGLRTAVLVRESIFDFVTRRGPLILGILALVAVVFLVLDLTSSSVRGWLGGHAYTTALVVGVFAGFAAGLLVDGSNRARERMRWKFLQRRAVGSLCHAAKKAADRFPNLELLGLPPIAGAPSPPTAADSPAVKSAAEAFDDDLAKWRFVLMATEEYVFLNHCEDYYRTLSAAALLLEAGAESAVLEAVRSTINDHVGYFRRLGHALDQEALSLVKREFEQVSRAERRRG